MSSPDYANVPVGFEAIDPVGLTSTTIRLLVDGALYPANVAGTPSVYGGGSVIDINASSTDTVARDLAVYEGRTVTTVGAATGTTTTTASTIVRQNGVGSFIADGWRPGMGVILLTPAGALEDAQSGILGLVSGVTATTLTLASAVLSVSAGLTAGTRIARCRQIGRVSLAIGQGTTSSQAAPLDVLGALQGGLTVKTERKFGVTDLLLVGAPVAPTAGTQLAVGGTVARY